ncbi:MAG: biotin carboxylase N-terminal domain-containing protein, partial [Pseudomonadota bacterium]
MHKLLIANRGEIACRVIRTARRMGIATVAVYSDADADTPHVRLADEAVRLGPAEAAKSYLDIAKIMAAIAATGADTVHPGYGFLSENAEFAETLSKAGIIFVGPPADAIRKMGLKDAAKALMKQAGVPVTPGYQGDDQSLQRMEKAAQAVGYPLLIKAVAGGGGKGMRAVERPEDFADALIAAKREGQASFSNDSVLIEKLIGRPRHVEVQVFADEHGNAVHLHERDCSLQRRHQKVIEEAPAPGLSNATRAALGKAAVKAARAIDYRGAGTIEFILDTEATDKDGNNSFYFMEMNTRLQVEHPVTELITGTDLVEWQLRVARGEPLPLAQDDIRVSGHAMEARFYAEDPESGFLPSTGTLTRLAFPDEVATPNRTVRVDSGVEQGGEVSVHYDPMIAKIVTHALTREGAIDALVSALDQTIVAGLKTNRAFLARLADHPAFRAAEVHTGFIPDHGDDLAPPAEAPRKAVLAAALAVVTARRDRGTAASAFDRHAGWRMNLAAHRYVDLYPADGEPMRVDLRRHDDGFEVQDDGAERLSARWLDDRTLAFTIDGTPGRAVVVRDDLTVEIRLDGTAYAFALNAEAQAGSAAGDGSIIAPMPGRVLSLHVNDGDTVDIGDRLLVLEAMKM